MKTKFGGADIVIGVGVGVKGDVDDGLEVC